MQHVPYKGGSAVIPDLVSGRISMNFSSISTMQASLKAGRVRPIAVTTLKRSPFLPDVPTFIESGMNMEVNAWYGLLTAGKTTRDRRSAQHRTAPGVGRAADA